MSDGAKKGKSGAGADAKPPKQQSGFGAFVGGLISGIAPHLSPRSTPAHPASGAARMEPVREDRDETGREMIFRSTDGSAGQAPMERAQRERRYVARALSGRGGGAGGANIPQSGGVALPAGVRSKMEPKLGADLSGVKVHTNGESAQAAGDLGARAFTVGQDVHFNAGEFSPGSKEGDKLLAHELTHVVQGQKSGVQRKAEDGAAGKEGAGEKGGDEVSDPSEPAEKEADAVSDKVSEEMHGDEKGEEAGGKDEKAGGKGEKAGGKKAGGKDEKAGGKDEKAGGKDEKAGEKDEKAGEKKAEEKPAAISAKLQGVGLKIFRATPPGGAADGQLTSPAGKPAKEGEVQVGAPPALQLYGYGGVRKVNGIAVKDMEKDLKDIAAKETAKAKVTPEETKKKGDYKKVLDDVNKTKQDDYLIFAGHIGVSIDNGATIYGFTPVAPEGMPKEQVITALHSHAMTFPGQVANDKPHFDLATRCAGKGWDTDVASVSRPVTSAQHAETKKKLQDLAGMAPGAHGMYYSFPLSDAQPGQYFVDTAGPDGKIVKGENQANCATFPGKIGIELPEQSGNLRFFMPALRNEASKGKK